jgi:hypothetical protein
VCVEFSTLEDFKGKVTSLIESYYPKAPVKKDTTMINEMSEAQPEGTEEIKEAVHPDMQKYVKSISRFGK